MGEVEALRADSSPALPDGRHRDRASGIRMTCSFLSAPTKPSAGIDGMDWGCSLEHDGTPLRPPFSSLNGGRGDVRQDRGGSPYNLAILHRHRVHRGGDEDQLKIED